MRISEQRQEAAHEVVVVGRSCRLPGAANVDQLWSNLLEGRCSISEVPDDRWSKAKHGHPRPKEPGKSYTWAAGALDDIWSFDPAAFGISPREAEQMDPQQRLLLELTWEALEDAAITRSAVAGSDVGVFVGASSPEYTVIRNTDMAGGDAYTATGGALSIISNRISHAFDFKGPSFTVDTACSSSLVALHQAMQALESGRIDTAIVGGINLLLGPFGFIVFSQASMLSPTGLCHTFDEKADGYVRAEGAVVLVLKTVERAQKDQSRMYARVVASGVNSDGRTNGIALPSRFSQAKLLREVYARAGVDPAQLAFVEAHGTGTRVGDPIEAFTIGDVLGRDRAANLPIGSIKSNIGHLEPASGLAGMLKAMLALEHDMLPASVNYDQPNPEIPFEELHLEVCAKATPIPRGTKTRYAGVNSFGFGGTNAHVVIGDPPNAASRAKRYTSTSDRFAISGANRAAVRELAREYGSRLASAASDETQEVAAAAVHQRELLPERLVLDWRSPRDLRRKLEHVADKDDEIAGVTWGTITEAAAPVAFVFSGNGGQWPGMGRAAYAANRHFREGFDEVDGIFDKQFGWSVTEALFANDLDQRLQYTHVAQPLIFAIQIGTVRALAAEGLEPAFVLGHSVGEIAAAVVAGALTLKDAVKVIHARSQHQELARDTGRMGVIVGSLEKVEDLVSEFAGVEIAGLNSPRNFTLAGPVEAVKALGAAARKRRMAFRQLELDYPFHCGLIDCVRDPLMRDLKGLKASAPRLHFVSTVTGEVVDGPLTDADYWWRNVREPVNFSAAVETAARQGARVFIEIGPRSVLLSAITETLEPTSLPFAALGVLERREEGEDSDPIRPAVVNAFVKGAQIDLEKLIGPEPARPIRLPTYPWQRRDFRIQATAEAVSFTLETRWHRLIGSRNTADGVEWTGQLDTAGVPELADHVVGGQAILPGAAFVEIALSVARDWFETDSAAVLDLDIFQPLPLEHDRAKEVKARLSPTTNTVEILSRARLSRAGWQLHAVAKITQGTDTPISAELPSGPGEAVDVARIYAVAEAVGLHYGPAFRLLRSVERHGESAIVADLVPSAPHGDYRLDPARLDACFHAMFALFLDLKAERRGTAYIPVRFGHVKLTRPGSSPARVLLNITKAGERSIVVDFTLFDANGVAIGSLSEVRFQAARLRRLNLLAERALHMVPVRADGTALGRAEASVAAHALLEQASASRLVLADAEPETGEQLLLEGWATAASYEIARRFAPSLAISAASVSGLPAGVASWFLNLLQSLEQAGLATIDGDGWRIAEESSLPPSSVVLRTLAADAPNRSSELLLASAVTAALDGPGMWAESEDPRLSPASVESYELGGTSVRGASETLDRLVGEAGLLEPAGRAARVLQVGYGPLSSALKSRSGPTGLRLTIFEPNAIRLERAKLAIGSGHAITFVDSLDGLADDSIDLVVSAERLHRMGGVVVQSELSRVLAPGGILAAVEPLPSQFRDVTLGLTAGWFESGATPEFPIGPVQSAESWTSSLASSGFANATATPIGTGHEAALLILADAPSGTARTRAARRIEIRPAGQAAGEFATRLETLLASDTHQVAIRHDGAAESPSDAEVTLFLAVPGTGLGNADAVQELCLRLKESAEACVRAKSELWIVSANSAHGPGATSPIAAALVAFSRTLVNETPGLVLRRVSAAGDVSVDTMAEATRNLLANTQTETDFVVGADGCRVLRLEILHDVAASADAPDAGARLERGHAGGLAGLAWTAAESPAPGPGEVEVTVEASGLNFRDVMWAMSLLPDDILEDGFAGPTLGLECAGRVASVGAGVSRVKVGDRVLAFAPSAFASAVTVPESVVAAIPPDSDLEAAATMPVAFLTAYYGLVTLAGLKRDEWVLIHGAAGGVGLAAVQIAQERGARIVATAGALEKRELLRSLGVEHVLNSRSSDFADDIRRVCPGGVDVVLNSLAGEAMERGLSVLKPFGRFIELGKRDYVANTRIGLRPFRRNLSYFGVDVDQLLSDRDRASEIFGEVVRRFAAGIYKPLPYRVYPAAETVDAFRLMQQSGHIGKILLRPPARPDVSGEKAEFAFDPERTHLMTGAFGGFGLETALWLADRGVRHLVLMGRSGPQSEDAQTVVAALRSRGVNVRAEACDVSDRGALSRLLADIRRTMPPLAGVMHAAMVLEDSLLANLAPEQFARVLSPKVTGADNLDELTGSDRLDYFVLFSSITTIVGNPGQAAYVAANGYLEGVARQRRERGQPALALAWGAISDVGVLARQKGLAESLAKRVGVKAMPAREALDLMAQALARPGAVPDEAVIAIGSLDWSAAKRLPVLASPTFAGLVRDGATIDTGERETIDLRTLVGTAEPDKVRKQVIEVIIEEIATVLRVPKQDVSMAKRLAEVGLDSLMAIELAGALQERFELASPPTGSVGTLTVPGLAEHLINFVHAGAPDDESRVNQALYERHAGEQVDLGELAPVMEVVHARSQQLKGLLQ